MENWYYKMVNLKELITLIVPVRERHYNLPCIVDYYKDTPYRKIIYDTSIEKYEGDLTGFEYFHKDPEYQHLSYLNSYSLVDTPFLLNCPDDDIMTHNSVYECTKFMHENRDYSACDGLVVEWNPDDNTVLPERKSEVFKSRVLHNWEADINLLQRLNFAIAESSRSVLHSVLRTEDSVEIMQNFIDNRHICPINFLDRVYTFAAACKGKFKTLPIVHHVRTSNRRANSDRVMDYSQVAAENIDGYGLEAGVSMANHLDDYYVSSYSHFLAKETKMEDFMALQYTKQLFSTHFRLRQQNGGGGYFGPNLPLSSVELPHKKENDIIEEALKSMRL
jgi:glycosyltransferase domain-containing protein